MTLSIRSDRIRTPIFNTVTTRASLVNRDNEVSHPSSLRFGATAHLFILLEKIDNKKYVKVTEQLINLFNDKGSQK